MDIDEKKIREDKSTETSIINQIERCKEDYKTRTGVEPTKIYLGANKIIELYHWSRLNTPIEWVPTIRTVGKRITGLNIHEVKRDLDHMECGD